MNYRYESLFYLIPAICITLIIATTEMSLQTTLNAGAIGSIILARIEYKIDKMGE